MRTRRVQRAIYWRCRQGDAEALSTLLYALGDEIYTCCMAAAPDEGQAADAAAAVWRKLASALGGVCVGGDIAPRARGLAFRELKARWGHIRARHALVSVRSVEPLQMPPELGARLLDELLAHAPLLRERSRRRAAGRRRALAATVSAMLLTGVVVWQLQVRALQAQTPQLRFEVIQQRIVSRNLVAAVRDALAELPDPSGADRHLAQLFERATLVLEELANARDIGIAGRIGFIGERVEREELAWLTAQAADEYEGRQRTDLLEVALVLEEVTNL